MSQGRKLDQEEVRHRFKAARILRRITSYEELAARIDPSEKLSARTLRKLDNREAEITLRALRPIAEALDIPLEWFTTPEAVWAPFEGGPGVSFEERLRQIEAEHRELGELVRRHLEAEPGADAPAPAPHPGRRAPQSSRRSTAR